MSKYNDFICEIITNFGQHRKTAPNPDGIIYERHHIKPRCMGGTDDIFNLIDLTPREHYIAHKLLAEEYPNEEKIVCAWHFMSVIKQNRYEATPEEYAASREAIIRSQGEMVYQLDNDGNIVACFNSAREAGRQLNTSPSHIIECCNKKRYQVNGYFWQTAKDYITNGFQPREYRGNKTRVSQYTLDGAYISTYSSYAEAGKAVGRTGAAIRQAVTSGRQSANYLWRKEE